jgi:uncharacterized protein with PQ loop repeat
MNNEIIPSIANILSIGCNIPLIYTTIKIGKANDISLSFLLLRILASLLWIYYSIMIIINYQIMVSNLPGLISSSVVLYYKCKRYEPLYH